MSNKYYKLSSKERKLSQPLELKFIKLSSFALTTFLATFLSASILTPPQSSSASEPNLLASTSDTTYSLTLTSSGTTLNIGATPGGSLTAAVDTVNVITNNPYGYQLYLSTNSTDSNSNRLYLDGDSTKTYFSPTSGTFLNPQPLSSNSWGYALAESDASAIRTKLSQTATTYFDSTYSTTPSNDSVWASVPIKGSEQLIKSASTATSDSGTSTEVYYAASATTALKPGTYSGTVLYTLIAESGATSETATVSPSTIDANTENQSIIISTPLPANASQIGDVTVTIGTDNTCAVTNKSNNATTSLVEITCTAPALAEGTYTITVSIPFYDKTYTLKNSLTYQKKLEYMQDFTSAKCNALTTNTDSINLLDKRDDNEYIIRKLDDGNCWMVSNFRLGKANTAITLTSTDSDVSSNTTIPASAIMDSGSGGWNNSSYHIYVRSDANGGNLYNWYTATAGTGTSGMSSSSATNTNNASSSICPKGWKLPKGGNTGTGSFQGLGAAAGISNSSAGATKILNAPYSFSLSGRYLSSLTGQNVNSGYWSRSAYTRTAEAYGLYLGTSSVSLQDDMTKSNGYSVRCLFVG